MADDRLEFATLPLVTELDTEVQQRVIALLEILDSLTKEKAQVLTKESDAEEELERLQKAHSKPGFRHGRLVFASQPVAGRRSLDRGLLLENGCSASIIADSYKTGTPSTRCTFKKLPEESK